MKFDEDIWHKWKLFLAYSSYDSIFLIMLKKLIWAKFLWFVLTYISYRTKRFQWRELDPLVSSSSSHRLLVHTCTLTACSVLVVGVGDVLSCVALPLLPCLCFGFQWWKLSCSFSCLVSCLIWPALALSLFTLPKVNTASLTWSSFHNKCSITLLQPPRRNHLHLSYLSLLLFRSAPNTSPTLLDIQAIVKKLWLARTNVYTEGMLSQSIYYVVLTQGFYHTSLFVRA
jgi:hypothetical protein